MEELSVKGAVKVEQLSSAVGRIEHKEMKAVAGYDFYMNIANSKTPISIASVMINDWIAVESKFLNVIENNNAIGGKYSLMTEACKVIGVLKDTIMIDECCIEPISYYGIPITYDILELNGWNTPFGGGYSSQYVSNDGNVCVTLDAIHKRLLIRIADNTYDFPRPKFIHELQHSLRICGLNKLADCFNI